MLVDWLMRKAFWSDAITVVIVEGPPSFRVDFAI
jgi:hypothetical protein